MSANSFGSRFVITSFGESHGTALGVVIDGCPAGVHFNLPLLVKELQRRRPGQHSQAARSVTSDRKEEDVPEVLSGIFNGKTIGSPIAMIIRNKDQRSQDYSEIAQQARPGHADDMWKNKFTHVDHRGGGRASGRETVARVIAGAVAQMYLAHSSPKMKVVAFARQIGPVILSDDEISAVPSLIKEGQEIDSFVARLPHLKKSQQVEKLLLDAKTEGKSYGGEVELWITDPEKNLGQPVFHKLKADLAAAFLGVGATCSVELGAGHTAKDAEGSEFHRQQSQDHYGGIRGGISTGEKISLRIGFKPTATVLHTATKGRHDPCIIPRAIPVLEAMAYLVLADHLLWSKTDRI